MDLRVGDHVRIKHGTENGHVTGILPKGRFMVEIEGMVFKYKRADLVKVVLNAADKHGDYDVPREHVKDLSAELPKEVYMTLRPEKNESGAIIAGRLDLHNSYDEEVPFALDFYLNGRIHFSLGHKDIPAHGSFCIGVIALEELNDSPVVELALDIEGKIFEEGFRIKADKLFKKMPMIESCGYEAVLYPIKMAPRKQGVKTAKKADKAVLIDPNALKERLLSGGDTSLDAQQHFVDDYHADVLDIHIEKLTGDWDEMSPAEMLDLQLRTFEQELNRVIAHGLDRFVVIHGVGEGKLKNELHRILRTYKEVRHFENRYHRSYGEGATFIDLA